MNVRELKCKAWDRHKQKMGKVTGIIFSDSQHTLVRYQFIDERGRKIDEQSHIDEKGHGVVALLWYTGLKDKNGKEIYEGDIVKRIYPTTTIDEFIGAVEYHDGTYFLIGEDREYDVTFLYDDTIKNTVEVIGNIYENPELINS